MAPSKDPYGERILAPLSRYYSDPDVVEVRVNRPFEVTLDVRGKEKRLINDRAMSISAIEDICRSLANLNGVKFDPDTHPNLSCLLPGNHRFECLVGGSTGHGVSLAIRCKHPYKVTWEEMAVPEAVVHYLQIAMANRKNIIISGSTNTGKTTFLNKLLEFWPDDMRVVAAEDTPELEIDRFWDGQALKASRLKDLNAGRLDWKSLFDHKMRITPDAILFGEISTENAVAALKALSSGATGFMCTVHSESPLEVINNTFVQNVKWSGESLDDIPGFLSKKIDLIVQIKRNRHGTRKVTHIYEPKHRNYILEDDFPEVEAERRKAS